MYIVRPYAHCQMMSVNEKCKTKITFLLKHLIILIVVHYTLKRYSVQY